MIKWMIYRRPAGLIVAAVVTICNLTSAVAAQEYPSAVGIRAVLPDNQISNASYFDLRLSPGDSQTVQLEISNPHDKSVEATVELNRASTGLNGTIIYNNTDTMDESMKYPITQIARVTTSVVQIPAQDSALVDIGIHMPKEPIDGVILGGLRVNAEFAGETPSIEPPTGEGIQIKNKFAYVIGLKLSQTDDDVMPDFHLKNLAPGLVNHSTAVILNIQNSEPFIAKNMLFSARIFRKGADDVIRELAKENAEMAPNSNCDYVVDWGNTPIQPGTYRMLARIQHEDQVWEWDEEFTIGADKADDVNAGALGLEKNAIPVWVYILGALLLILVLLLILLLIRLGSKKKEQRD